MEGPKKLVDKLKRAFSRQTIPQAEEGLEPMVLSAEKPPRVTPEESKLLVDALSSGAVYLPESAAQRSPVPKPDNSTVDHNDVMVRLGSEEERPSRSGRPSLNSTDKEIFFDSIDDMCANN